MLNQSVASAANSARAELLALPQDDDIVLSTDHVAAACSMSRWTLCDLIRRGRGPRIVKFSHKKIGVRVGDLRAWIRSRMVPAE